MNNKTKTRSLRVAIIAIALLLCFALAVGVTSALYQARRQATGTLNMDKGIVIDYKGFNKGDENIWQRETTTSFKLFEETNAQPGQEISVYPSGIRANVDSINFYARLKLEYIFYNVANGVETKVDLPNPKSLIKTSNDFFASNWVPSTDGYYYFGENTTLNQFSKDNQNFENLFADGAKFIIEGANFEGETAGEGGGFVVNGTAINKIVVYLTLETLQGDATAEQAKDLGWVITTLNEQIVDITNIPDEKPEINIDDIISDDKKDGEITITGDPKQKLTITIGSKAFYGCSKLKLTLSNSEKIEYRIATDAFSTGATIMYGIDNVSSKLINPSTLGHTTVGFDGKWQVSAPGLYLFLPSPITPTTPSEVTSSYGDFQYTDDQGIWYFDLLDDNNNEVDASTLASIISRNGASTFGASTYANTDNYTARINRVDVNSNITSLKIPSFVGTSDDSKKLAVTHLWGNIMAAGSHLPCPMINNSENITCVIIPEGIKTLGSSVFKSCTNLETIYLPSTLTSFDGSQWSHSYGYEDGTYVNLQGCVNLKNIFVDSKNINYHIDSECLIETVSQKLIWGNKTCIIPDSVVRVDSRAFVNGLTSVHIGAGIDNVSWLPANTRNITISENNPYLTTDGKAFYAVSGGGLVLQKYYSSDTTYVIPDRLNLNHTSLPVVSIENIEGLKSLKGLTIPDNVLSIGGRLDSSCKFNFLHIGAGITSSSWLFRDHLSGIYSANITISVSEENPHFVTDGKALYEKVDNGLEVKYYFSTETSYTMPNSLELNSKSVPVVGIGEEAFNHIQLENLTLSDNLIYMKNSSISASKLVEITFPKSFREIRGGSAYISHCFSAGAPDIINVDPENKYFKSINNCLIEISSKTLIVAAKNSVIPNDENVVYIGNFAMMGNVNSSIIIPENIKAIGFRAFQSCKNCVSITIEGSASIDNYAFDGCENLKTFNVLGNITSIGDYAFYGRSKLTSIALGDKLTSIGYSVFEDCTSLTSIVLPEGIKEIPSSCFRGCTNLESVTIPSTCTTIGNSAFENCSNLTTVIWNISYDLGGVNATGPELSSYTGSQTSGLTMDDIIKSAPTNVESGFTFEGWSDGVNIYQPGDKITFSLANRRLTAVWSNYKLAFDANGGEGSIDAIIVAKGGSVNLPSLSNFSREGYVATGWTSNKDSSYREYKEGDSYTPTQNTIIYVFWVKVYNDSTTGDTNLKFDLNGGEGKITFEGIYSSDDDVILPEITGVTKEGYKFTGWKYRYSGRDQFGQPGTRLSVGYNFDPSYPIVAQWRELITVTLIFNDGVNDDVVLREIDGVTEINFETYSAKVVAPEGKYFYSWKTASGYYGGTTSISYFANGTTFTAYFKNYETFTLNPNGGDGDSVTFTRSKTNNILDLSKYQITRDGYVLLGWNTDPDSTRIDYKYNEIIEGNVGYPEDDENVILYAVWEKLSNEFTTGYTNVKFDLNGGTGKLTFEGAYREGDTFKLPGIDGVTKEGYTFLGWSTSSDSTTPSYYPGNNRDFYNETYYAIWSKIITISFDLNGGEGTLPDPVQTAYNTKIVFNTGTNFTKEGYKFAGWQLVDGNGNNCGTYNTETNQTFYNNGENYTFKAMWSEPQTITFYNDDTKSQSFTMTGFFDIDGITFPEGKELTKEGYILVGWNTSANSSYVNYSIGQKYSNFSDYTELYAVWKSESEVAKIIFNFSEVEGQENIIKIGYDSSFRISDVVGSIIENIRNASGQVIAGWSWTQGSSNVDQYNDNWIYFSNYQGQTKTLYPVWKNVLTINFDLNGGKGTLPESFEVWERKSFDIPEVSLTKDGFMFAGWAWRLNSAYTDYDNGETNRTFYESDTYGSTTLYAIWKQPLTISFNANGGEGEVPKDIITYTEGRIDIPEVTLTRDGYVFLGWSFNKNPIWDGIEYSNGVEDRGYYQFSSKTLYAVWGNTVTYIFDLNGGIGTVPGSISADYNTMISAPSGNGFERAGYKFKGWSINPNSNNYNWSSGSSYAYGISGTITMYAVWEVLTDQVYVGSLTQSEIDAVQALWNGHTSRSELTDASLLNSMSDSKLHARFSILAYLNNTSLEYNTNGDSYYGIGYGTRYFRLSTNSYTFEFENSLPTGWMLVNWRYEVKASGDVTIVNGRAQAIVDYTYAGFENSSSEERLMMIFVLPNQPAESESVSVSISGLSGNALEALLNGSGSDTLQYLLMSGIKVEIYDAEGNLLWLGKPNDSNEGFVKYRFATGTYKIRFYTTNVNGVTFIDNDNGTEVTGMNISEITKGDGYSEFTINYAFAEGNPNLKIFFKMADVSDLTKLERMDVSSDFCGPYNIVGNWFKGMVSAMGLAYTDMSDADKNYAGYCGMLMQEYFNGSICKIPSFSIYTENGKIIENSENLVLELGVEYTIKFAEEVKEVMLLRNDSMSVNSITNITYNEATGTWDATFSVSESTMLMFLTADLDLSQYEDLPAYDAATDYSQYLEMH